VKDGTRIRFVPIVIELDMIQLIVPKSLGTQNGGVTDREKTNWLDMDEDSNSRS